MTRDELFDELSARLQPETVDALRAEFAALDAAGEDDQFLIRLLEASYRLPLPTPPATLRQELRDLFDPPLRRDLDAVLVHDSREQTELVGVRSAATTAGAWSLGFTCEVADITIDIWPLGPNEAAIDGQVMTHGTDVQAWQATLAVQPDVVVEADELGYFRFEGLAPGPHRVVVANNRHQIGIDLEIAAP